MWQLYSFGSLLFGAVEETIDKKVMVETKSIGLIHAAWIRNTIALLISIVVAILIQHSYPEIIFSLPILMSGILSGIQAITYTVMLKHVEITTSNILASFVPLIFLPIDFFLLDTQFVPRQIIGVVILVIGGVVFLFRKNIASTPLTVKRVLIFISIFFFDVLVYGVSSYVFKDYFENGQLSETSFLVSTSLITALFLSVLLCGNLFYTKEKFSLKNDTKYVYGSFLSKLSDYGNSFFLLKALTIVSVSQATAMKVFAPLILLVVVFITQHKLKMNLEEGFDRKSLVQKILGVLLICLGAFLAR